MCTNCNNHNYASRLNCNRLVFNLIKLNSWWMRSKLNIDSSFSISSLLPPLYEYPLLLILFLGFNPNFWWCRNFFPITHGIYPGRLLLDFSCLGSSQTSFSIFPLLHFLIRTGISNVCTTDPISKYVFSELHQLFIIYGCTSWCSMLRHVTYLH